MDEIKFTKEYEDEKGNRIEFPKPPEPEVMCDTGGSVNLLFPIVIFIIMIILFLSK